MSTENLLRQELAALHTEYRNKMWPIIEQLTQIEARKPISPQAFKELYECTFVPEPPKPVHTSEQRRAVMEGQLIFHEDEFFDARPDLNSGSAHRVYAFAFKKAFEVAVEYMETQK
jgi:hypothetical protein